jgi:SAM-dependent methyltransferase
MQFTTPPEANYTVSNLWLGAANAIPEPTTASLLAIASPAAGVPAAVLMGFGIGCGFSLSMVLPIDVAHDGASVAATTGLMLLVGYVIAAGSPVGLGAVRDLTGGYAAVLWVLVGTASAAIVLGATLARLARRACLAGEPAAAVAVTSCRSWGRRGAGCGGVRPHGTGPTSPSRIRSCSTRRPSTPSASRRGPGCSTRAAARGWRCRARARGDRHRLDAGRPARDRASAAAGRPPRGRPEALPYADDSFDAVTAFNAVQHTGDPTGALREIGRVARPGARIAVVTWARPSSATCARCWTRSAAAPAASAGSSRPFALARPAGWRHSSRAPA